MTSTCEGEAYPALVAWRKRGERRDRMSGWQFDALWRAAMSEMSAKEAAALGQHNSWKHHMEQARRALMSEVA